MNSSEVMEPTVGYIKNKVFPKILLVFFLICFYSNTLIAQDNQTFSIGSIEAKSGEKVSGSLIIEKGINQETFIPITIINGAKSGPVLTLVAGIHGTEYVPIITLQQLINEINTSELFGTIIMVHIANIPSYKGRAVYLSPIDNKNLNRVFPGKKNGTISERIAYTITNEIIKKSDFYIDLHGGEFNEHLVNFIYFYYGCPEGDLCKKSSMIAHAMGNKYLIPYKYNSLPDSVKNYWSELAAYRNGVASVTVEIGDNGQTDLEEIEFAKRGIINVLRTIGMLEGEVFKNEHPLYLYDENKLISNHNGIFYSLVEKGQYIVNGTLVGYSTDYWGNILEEFHSPISGIVEVIIKIPTINKGESVCVVSKVKEKFEE